MNAATVRPRVILVNRVYWPDEQATAQLLADLAEGLAARAWPVTVLTAQGENLSPREQRHGVNIVRLGGRSGRPRNLTGRLAAYVAFTLAVRAELRRRLQPGDRLVVMTDPPTLAPFAAGPAHRAGARLIHWIQDIHPEIGFALRPGWPPAALGSPWIRWRDAAWRGADACVALGGDMAGFVASRGLRPDRVRVIPNWAPAGIAPAASPPRENFLRREWNLTDKFVVAYSGNLGRVHALEPVLAAAAALRDLPDSVFLFCGDGPQKESLMRAAHAEKLTNVHFVPPQPRERLAESLSVGDIHLVTLRSGCERYVYPSKLYGILAVGRPILFVGPPQCELALAVRHAGAGMVAADNDPTGIAAAIRSLRADPALRASMGAAAAAWSKAGGGLEAALAKWHELLEKQ